ncbi:hypothetical protein QAD02_000108 [Eretmocerus hayati]|uniref:Uncharacterized protein n=1 Tax=Eretmocerus hayati TaxID=131215 RepID=A0ACC2NCQ4_9HYME|nr:hypothetical protein QAD02_000108 [Eretmocerus hayati]
MSSSSTNKLQSFWDRFIHAEPQSHEKSCWLDIFLSELLAQIKEGHDIKDALSFCWSGEGSVATLVGCELLSDIHRLCETVDDVNPNNPNENRPNGDVNSGDLTEIQGVREYLSRGRGWRCLGVLQLLSQHQQREIGCSRELSGLLLALYPLVAVASSNENGHHQIEKEKNPKSRSRNPYIAKARKVVNDLVQASAIELESNGTIGSGGGSRQNRKKNNAKGKLKDDLRTISDKESTLRNGQTQQPQQLLSDSSQQLISSGSRRRRRRRSSRLDPQPTQQQKTQLEAEPSSESEQQRLDNGIMSSIPPADTTNKLRVGPANFEYFENPNPSATFLNHEANYDYVDGEVTSISTWQIASSDKRVKSVLDSEASRAELCLLMLDLLRDLEPRPVAQTLKFALDSLWQLQFGRADEIPDFAVWEIAQLKAAAARLMLNCLERALQPSEQQASGALVQNGLLPMCVRLLEDACIRQSQQQQVEPETAAALQEFVYSVAHGVLGFFNSMLVQQQLDKQQGNKAQLRLSAALELLRLVTESHDGRILERAMLCVLELSAAGERETTSRASRLMLDVGLLMGSLRRARQQLVLHASNRGRARPKHLRAEIEAAAAAVNGIDGQPQPQQQHHHHSDVLGVAHPPYEGKSSVVMVGSRSTALGGKALCCISALFSSLVSLMRQAQLLSPELQLRLIKTMSSAGVCCCFPPRLLFSSCVYFLRRASAQCHIPTALLLERILYQELGGYPVDEEACNLCASPNSTSWDFVEQYSELLSPDEPRLCQVTMRHLLRVTPFCSAGVRRELLFRVFQPSLLRAKSLLAANKQTEFSMIKFLVQSCLSAIANLLVEPVAFSRYADSEALDEVLILLPNQAFVKCVYALMEICVIMEIKSRGSEQDEINQGVQEVGLERPMSGKLFEFLKEQTDSLLKILGEMQKEKEQEEEEDGEAVLQTPSAEDNSKLRIAFHQASGVWRAAAGVVLCSPSFRPEFAKESIFKQAVELAKALAVAIATDRLNAGNKFAFRVMEAVLTCCLVATVPGERDIVAILGDTLMNEKVVLSGGISALVEILLQVSMLRPSHEQTVPQHNRSRLSTMAMDISLEWGDAEDSSTGEYIPADDGYEADVEVPVSHSQDSSPRRKAHLITEPELQKGNANANPPLCALAIDLLIYFAKHGLDGDRCTLVTNSLRRVSIICKESTMSCAALAGSGVIRRLLEGFEDVLKSRDPELQELQYAVLEVLTLLAMQSISPSELSSYLSFFKLASPPLKSLLEPLLRLVVTGKPQPHFILSFPMVSHEPPVSAIKNPAEEFRNMDKAENLVSNFKRKHLLAEICSPWSVHAVCLPIGSELAWPVWLQGCSISLWLRVERGGSGSGGRSVHVAGDGNNARIGSESDSLSDWGVLSDNWSRDVAMGSSTPPVPSTILHMMSVGFETLVLETWLDLKSDKLILRLTRPDDKTNRTISETCINGMLPSGRWHHLAINFNDTILNKHSAVVQVVIWIDGWKEIKAQLPFDGLLLRKAGTTCVLLGQTGSSVAGAWYLSNLMIFRCPVFTNERALYLASLGPNFTNLADCILSDVKPDFAPLIASGVLNGVREIKYEGGKFDSNRRKSFGGMYLRHPVEIKVSDSKIDWDLVMDTTHSHLSELQDNLLLNYEALNPSIVHLYPQAVANSNVVKNLFPGQPGFRVVSVPEHRVSQQPPLSVAPITNCQLLSQSYKGLVSSASLMGGMPIFLYLFARVIELDSTEEEQALALSIVLHLVRSDSEMLYQYRSEGGASLLFKVLESSRCYAGKHMLKAILDAACDSPVIVKDVGTKNHLICHNSEAVVTDPELIKIALEAWRTWATYDALNLLLQAMLFLLKDQHPQREFNAAQLNRVHIVESILFMCKEHFMYEDVGVTLDATTGSAVVELIRALMGAPPEFPHLVMITDYLVLVHQASETYVTHSRYNMYFLLLPMDEPQNPSSRANSLLSSTSSTESMTTLERSKLSKGRANARIQMGSSIPDLNNLHPASEPLPSSQPAVNGDEDSSPGHDTSAGEDSGIAPSEGSANQQQQNQQTSQQQNQQQNQQQQPNQLQQLQQSDRKRACHGLVCEGLLLLLRDALRVLPDSQVGSVLRGVVRLELLLVLANDPDPRVRTALVKLVHAYLQRANDEQINRIVKQKYFVHLANQVALYPGSEPLVVTLENLALKGPGLAAMPLVLAMLPRAAATDVNVARPLVSFLTDLVTKSPNSLRVVLEQGLPESLGRAIVNAAHAGSPSSLYRDLHVLLVAVATRLLDSPGSQQAQSIADLHVVLNHAELRERSICGPGQPCVAAAREAQVALFDGEFDLLTAKVSAHSGFRLKSATSYLASASHLSNTLTTSSEQSEHGSKTSSYTSLASSTTSSSREPGKGELNERLRLSLNRAVDFITSAHETVSNDELQLTKRVFGILLQGVSGPLSKGIYWVNSWSIKPALRKNTARVMVWLMAPHQSLCTRVYVIRALMEEPKTRETISTLLETHPQIEQKFTVFLWELLQRKDEMSTVDALLCTEFKEALKIWNLAKGIDRDNSNSWNEELTWLRRELARERDVWVESQIPIIQRIITKSEPLIKQLTESAMSITRSVVEEQNRERKILMERLKQLRASEAQAIAKWRDLARRLTHERAPWHFAESYPTSWELDPTEGPARVRIRLQRCHLDIKPRFFLSEHSEKLEAAKIEPPLSYLFSSGKQDANATALIERLHTSERIRKMAQVKVVTPQAELPGEALIGETCFYFVPDNPNLPLHTDIALGGLDLAMAGGTAWRLEDIRELHRRRYQLQEKAIEIFLVTGRTYLLAFNSSKERDEFTLELSNCNMPRRVPGDDLNEALALWRNGTLTNWEYVTCLNKLAGRSYNDLMQYPVFPFVLSDYTSEKIDLTDPKIYSYSFYFVRNFHFINEQFSLQYLKQALSEGLNLIALNQEPFHYGSHYSNSGTVLHFLVRLPPFTSMFLSYQDDNFDIPDRTFHALATTWRLTSCDSTTDVKELIPEFFYLPEFLLNFEGFNFGVRQNGSRVGDVELPKWCGGDARLFVLAHRAALESEIVREVLPFWIDLVFGFRQTGKPAVEAINVFHPATYYGFNVEQIEDPLERQAWETMIKTYGQTPAQLFKAAHPLPIQNLSATAPTNVPRVIDGVDGIRWGNYVGAPGNEPVVCWKHKHRLLLASLVPLSTGDVFGLPSYTTLILAYSKDKSTSMLSSTSVLGAALASWKSTDGIARLKTKKEQPPRPLIRSSGLDPVTMLKSSPDCGQLWVGYASGRIVVYACIITPNGKIEFNSTSPSVLLAHRSRISVIELSRSFSIAVSGDIDGILVVWDLNSLTYVRSIFQEQSHPISLLSISETLGDIAVVYQISSSGTNSTAESRSDLVVYTINARLVGSVASRRKITSLCYSSASEGSSVNVIATGLENGVIRLWSSWDLRLVREIGSSSKGCGAIIAIAWSHDQHHLYAATEDCTVIIWEGARKLHNGTPKFVNLSTL